VVSSHAGSHGFRAIAPLPNLDVFPCQPYPGIDSGKQPRIRCATITPHSRRRTAGASNSLPVWSNVKLPRSDLENEEPEPVAPSMRKWVGNVSRRLTSHSGFRTTKMRRLFQPKPLSSLRLVYKVSWAYQATGEAVTANTPAPIRFGQGSG